MRKILNPRKFYVVVSPLIKTIILKRRYFSRTLKENCFADFKMLTGADAWFEVTCRMMQESVAWDQAHSLKVQFDAEFGLDIYIEPSEGHGRFQELTMPPELKGVTAQNISQPNYGIYGGPHVPSLASLMPQIPNHAISARPSLTYGPLDSSHKHVSISSTARRHMLALEASQLSFTSPDYSHSDETKLFNLAQSSKISRMLRNHLEQILSA